MLEYVSFLKHVVTKTNDSPHTSPDLLLLPSQQCVEHSNIQGIRHSRSVEDHKTMAVSNIAEQRLKEQLGAHMPLLESELEETIRRKQAQLESKFLAGDALDRMRVIGISAHSHGPEVSFTHVGNNKRRPHQLKRGSFVWALRSDGNVDQKPIIKRAIVTSPSLINFRIVIYGNHKHFTIGDEMTIVLDFDVDSIQRAMTVYGTYLPQIVNTSSHAAYVLVNYCFDPSITRSTAGKMLNLTQSMRELQLQASGCPPMMNKSEFVSKYPRVTDKGQPLNRLTQSQREAVMFCCRSNVSIPLRLIHGPPGTGKTDVAAEITLFHVLNNRSVLVTAQSHKAVDNLLERYIMRVSQCAIPPEDYFEKDNIIRTGTSLRCSEGILKLESFFTFSSRKEGLGGIRKGQVIFSTINSRMIKDTATDILIMDEAGQVMECDAWKILINAKIVILIGDHKQLPPVVLNRRNNKLSISLFERLIKQNVHCKSILLNQQFRMHPDINQFPSSIFYNGRVLSAPNVQSHTLSRPLPLRTMRNIWDELFNYHIVVLNTSQFGSLEDAQCYGTSKSNATEARICAFYAKKLLNFGVQPEDIGIITPYAGQTLCMQDELLRHRGLRNKDIYVSTVDGFQGSAKDCIIMTLVRSNNSGEVGFVCDPRRLNVALTRARRHLFIVCDFFTMTRRKGVLRHMISSLRAANQSTDGVLVIEGI